MKPSRGLHPRNRHESPANGGISIAQLAFAQYSVIRAIARVTASITRSARKRANRFRAIESHVLQVNPAIMRSRAGIRGWNRSTASICLSSLLLGLVRQSLVVRRSVMVGILLGG